MKWIKWALIAVAIILAMIGTATGIGFLVDENHVASSRAVYAAAPDAVWAVISDFPSGPLWRPGLIRVERGPDQNGHPVWVEVSEFGPMPLEVVELRAPEEMVLRIASDELPFGGTWTFEVRPQGSGSTLTITERGNIGNPIFRFMSRFVFGYNATMNTYLEALGKKLGEEVRAVPVAGS